MSNKTPPTEAKKRSDDVAVKFEKWWEAQETQGLSMPMFTACKMAAWNAWLAAAPDQGDGSREKCDSDDCGSCLQEDGTCAIDSCARDTRELRGQTEPKPLDCVAQSNIRQATPSARKDAPEQAVANIVCHAEGDRCLGCDHWKGKAPVCAYAPTNPTQRDSETVAKASILDFLIANDLVRLMGVAPFRWAQHGIRNRIDFPQDGFAHPPRLDAQTVEECAKVCDRKAKGMRETAEIMHGSLAEAAIYAAKLAEECAAAIRALRST